MKSTLFKGLLWQLVAYALALITAWYVVVQFDHWHPVWAALLADVVATIIVFGFSRALNNSSMYDPYWSVAPPFIALYFAHKGIGTNQLADIVPLISFLLIWAWSLRLTLNFLRGWPGLHHQDWRYSDLQEQHGKAYWWVSFAGIHMFPTLLVFIACLPMLAIYFEPVNGFNWLHAIGFVIAGTATLIELIADEQLKKYVKSNPPKGITFKGGLWKYSRHPNYFGEVSFWWGVFLMGLASNPSYWWTGVGALAITMLFVFISLPMMEKRMLERRTDYEEYQRKTSILVPWPPKR